MASIRRRGEYWYIRFRDETGRQTERKASRDKTVSRNMAKALEDRLQRIKLGLLDPREADAMEGEKVPLERHVQDYVDCLSARGNSPEHVSGVAAQLTWFLDETKIARLSQIRPSLAVTVLATLRDAGKSDRTCSHYAASLKSFTSWLKRDRRTREDMLADLERPRVVTEHRRSALSPDQAVLLVMTTRAQGRIRRGMTGLDRSWLYTLAMVTGFRRGELQSLSPESFSLDGNPPVVRLPGRDTKNSNDAIQPLPDHLIPDLRTWLQSKPEDTFLFRRDRNTAPLIRADLKAAGIAPAAFDFHCLRHCYVTQIVQCGGSVKDSMELARHSDASLTMGRYAHTRLEDLALVVNRLPDLSPHILPTNGVSVGLNGNTGVSLTASPVGSHVDPLGHVLQPHDLDSFCGEEPAANSADRRVAACTASINAPRTPPRSRA